MLIDPSRIDKHQSENTISNLWKRRLTRSKAGSTGYDDMKDCLSSSDAPAAWETSTWNPDSTDCTPKIIGPINWAGLPTELKEHILQLCLFDPQDSVVLTDQKRRRAAYARRGFGARHDLGPYEVVSRLGAWSSLLQVSRQVRTLVLRLYFIGRRGQIDESGFHVATLTYDELGSTIRRLDRYYQLMKSGCVPTDNQTTLLSQAYKHFPRMYPELKRYATFKHGIQTIHIEMGFKAYMHFFEIKVGSFKQYLEPKSLSYRIFDQMPKVRNITIFLPGKPEGGWIDDYWRSGPQIFHSDSPCPRILHRVIYERAAQVLVPYQNVCMTGFMDDTEEQCFSKSLAIARGQLQFTEQDFEDLYADCGGGIQLDEITQAGAWHSDQKDGDYWLEQRRSYVKSDLFPPKCDCTERCDRAEVWDMRESLAKLLEGTDLR